MNTEIAVRKCNEGETNIKMREITTNKNYNSLLFRVGGVANNFYDCLRLRTFMS